MTSRSAQRTTRSPPFAIRCVPLRIEDQQVPPRGGTCFLAFVEVLHWCVQRTLADAPSRGAPHAKQNPTQRTRLTAGPSATSLPHRQEGRSQLQCSESALQVGLEVVQVFQADGQADQAVADARVGTLPRRQAALGGGGWVSGGGLGVALDGC